ncbi:MAG: hypothetical protein ACE5R6_00035 [Candidatus Heimdallarchaeota archaeon]
MSKKERRGVITQGTIAEFMRKRTQLVGFSFGLFKHVQYVVEFLDNALDAVETARWKYGAYNLDLARATLKYTRTQKEDIFFEDGDDVAPEIDRLGEQSDLPSGNGDLNTTTDRVQLLIDASDQDIGLTTLSLETLISPIRESLTNEPIVIIRLQEMDIDSLASLPDSQTLKERMYSLEVFDNGVGLIPEDLEKFGRYLASSKSERLKQTRGSQGFGAPSAFSDAQNTTGKPITVLTKHFLEEQATVSVFYTTGKNVKQYIVTPTQVNVSFPHGSYIRLYYLNVPYRKGFVDTYIRRTSLLNAHATIIYIDPRNEVMVFNRRVSSFPSESIYAKPHPTSVSIGDFKEIIHSSSHSSLNTLFKESFCRVSNQKARIIIDNAQQELNARGTGLYMTTPQQISPQQTEALFQVLSKRKMCPYYLNLTHFRNLLTKSNPNHSILDVLSFLFADITKAAARKVLKSAGLKPQKLTSLSQDELDCLYTALNEQKLCPLRFTLKQLTHELTRPSSSPLLDRLRTHFCSSSLQVVQKVLITADEKLGNTSLWYKKPKKLTPQEISALFKSLNEIQSPKSSMSFSKFKTTVKHSSKQTLSALLQNELKISKTQISPLLQTVEKRLKYSSLITKSPSRYSDVEIHALYESLQHHMKCSGCIDSSTTLLQLLNNAAESSLQVWLENNFYLQRGEAETIIEKASKLLGGLRPLIMNKPQNLADEQINALYRSFRAQKYYSPPTDTVVRVGADVMDRVIQMTYHPDFVKTETRKPTSGKGLAFVVEATIAYGGDIQEAKRARDVLYRFVNRTPKLRDNSDCAIWKATASVNWKNYGVDQFDNGLPKGPIRIFVSVSGPFVHVMFKTQSKQALAEDETLISEIKLALEAVGRKLKSVISERRLSKQRERRTSVLQRYAKSFARSLSRILSSNPSKNPPTEQDLLERIIAAIDEDSSPPPSTNSKDIELES